MTIEHNVDDPDDHYIETVRISKNDAVYETYSYTSQPDKNTFTYVYDVSAENDDELEVFIECVKGGDGTKKITVESDEKTISVTVTPNISSVNQSASVTFTINATSGGDPVENADLDVNADHGEISNIVELGGGEYNFTYTAPDDRGGETETIDIRVRKDGFNDGEAVETFTIQEADIPPLTTTLDGVVSDGEYDFSASFDGGNYQLHWGIKNEIISIAIVSKDIGWVAIGLDPSTAMKDADMIFGWLDSNGGVHAIDAFSTGATGPHPPDTDLGGTTDFLDIGGTEAGGVTTIEFTRDLNTGDQYDKPIPSSGSVKIIWAYSGSDSFSSAHSRTNRGTGTIVMDTGESTEEDEVEFWPIHAFFMSVGMLSMLGGVYIAMFKKKEKWWLKYHRTLGLIGASSVIIGLLVGFYMVADSTGEHIRVGHAYFGIVSLLMAILTPTLGLLMFRNKKKIKTMKMIHRLSGRITIPLMILTILGGLSAAGVI